MLWTEHCHAQTRPFNWTQSMEMQMQTHCTHCNNCSHIHIYGVCEWMKFLKIKCNEGHRCKITGRHTHTHDQSNVCTNYSERLGKHSRNNSNNKMPSAIPTYIVQCAQYFYFVPNIAIYIIAVVASQDAIIMLRRVVSTLVAYTSVLGSGMLSANNMTFVAILLFSFDSDCKFLFSFRSLNVEHSMLFILWMILFLGMSFWNGIHVYM